LSVTSFEKTPILQMLTDLHRTAELNELHKQLNLFN